MRKKLLVIILLSIIVITALNKVAYELQQVTAETSGSVLKVGWAPGQVTVLVMETRYRLALSPEAKGLLQRFLAGGKELYAGIKFAAGEMPQLLRELVSYLRRELGKYVTQADSVMFLDLMLWKMI
ncbi:MAG: hypothetical protein H0Z35_06450 [Thermoanaerobacteraceae bacterium]|nr:hypothetical protein [Thermoanaerobacteraceae bacterium]